MKRILVGAAAAAALVAPGVASADVQGAIDYTYENTEYDSGSDFDAYSLGGAIATDVMHGLRLQADGRTTMQEWSTSEYSHGYAAVHLSGDLGGFNVGGFGGMLNYYGDPGTVFGVEARRGFGNFTIDGAIGFSNFDEADYEGTHYNIGGSYFFAPNFSINAGYSIDDIDYAAGYDLDTWSLGAAYQFSNNIELFGAWANTNYENNGIDYNETDSLQLGVRLNIGGGTLQDNANGGLWNSVREISDTYLRW
ncbi:MAG: porin [Hyphomonadaceae bacterium]|nr:porin [Hyphomonadaceae bacterium]